MDYVTKPIKPREVMAAWACTWAQPARPGRIARQARRRATRSMRWLRQHHRARMDGASCVADPLARELLLKLFWRGPRWHAHRSFNGRLSPCRPGCAAVC